MTVAFFSRSIWLECSQVSEERRTVKRFDYREKNPTIACLTAYIKWQERKILKNEKTKKDYVQPTVFS